MQLYLDAILLLDVKYGVQARKTRGGGGRTITP